LEVPAQSKLFIIEGEVSSGTLELFPTVWQAAENLASKGEDIRHAALDELLSLNALRFSPLVVYITATRLRDPSLTLRARVIESLANVLRVDADGELAPDQVRAYLVSYITQLEQVDIHAILEVGVYEKEIHPHIAKLLNYCPQAGKILSRIVADRDASIEIRRFSTNFIGQIGFVEALPTLERLRNRLETRQGVQRGMPFASPASADESSLLPDINEAISLLQIPGS
jgi:hypothetical protein